MKTMIEMAHEVYGEHVFWAEDQLLKLKAFEALVRADEREECAKVCEDAPEPDGRDLAERIRNRGNS